MADVAVAIELSMHVSSLDSDLDIFVGMLFWLLAIWRSRSGISGYFQYYTIDLLVEWAVN